MRNFLLLIICLIKTFSYSQNLVMNGNFDQKISCPNGVGQITLATSWSSPSQGSPDYFDSCTSSSFIGVPFNYWGWQMPLSGDAYAGLNLIYYTIPEFREYIQGELTSTLQAHQTYIFQMHLNKSDNSSYATDAIGVHFSGTKTTGVTNTNPLNFTPQLINPAGNFINDTSNWVVFSAPYTASGGEKYFLIGNFKSDANTTTTLTTSSGNQSNGYVYIDNVSLTIASNTGFREIENHNSVYIYPNPFNDELSIDLKENEQATISIYDIYGKLVHEMDFNSEVKINTYHFEKGLYYFRIRCGNQPDVTGKIIK